tara:strand:- start:133 stop:450 length:318 start_codon:yes stop_codon:yes gene_type:complete
MKALLLLLMLLPLMPAKADQPNIKCPGNNTPEMRWCASKRKQESNAALQKELPRAVLMEWQRATQAVCSVAKKPYLQGTIYPQLVVGCDDNLNRALLEEFKGLGD